MLIKGKARRTFKEREGTGISHFQVWGGYYSGEGSRNIFFLNDRRVQRIQVGRDRKS